MVTTVTRSACVSTSTGIRWTVRRAGLPSRPMTLLFVALSIGVIAGFVTGGRPSNVSRRTVAGTPLLLAAVVAQIVPSILDASPSAGLACVIVSYVLLTAF